MPCKHGIKYQKEGVNKIYRVQNSSRCASFMRDNILYILTILK
jgi:hypothetical protein